MDLEPADKSSVRQCRQARQFSAESRRLKTFSSITETQESITAIIDNVFAPQLVGMEASDREQIHAVLGRTVNNHVAKGSVDTAVWDAIGKTLGTPVHKLLGGYTDRMRVSHMLGFRPAEELLDEALRFGERVDTLSPASAILDAAKDADLIVVGSRGHGGFPGLHLGSARPRSSTTQSVLSWWSTPRRDSPEAYSIWPDGCSRMVPDETLADWDVPLLEGRVRS